MPPSTWGPPTWTFLHVLAEKICEDEFKNIIPNLIVYLRRIVTNLPCPNCANHGTQFLNRVNFNNIKTKQDFKNILCYFHNNVNRQKRKPLFNPEGLSERYSSINMVEAYNGFISVFQSGNNFKLLADSLQRKLLIKDLREWFLRQLGKTIDAN